MSIKITGDLVQINITPLETRTMTAAQYAKHARDVAPSVWATGAAPAAFDAAMKAGASIAEKKSIDDALVAQAALDAAQAAIDAKS